MRKTQIQLTRLACVALKPAASQSTSKRRSMEVANCSATSEHLLRIIQSFVIDPGRPPRTGEDRRDYMRR